MTGVLVQADGGSRGNPGPAGYGAVVMDGSGTVLAERAASIGRATNNVAEYSGLIAGLEAALELGATRVDVQMDSKLVIEQMSGRWQVKHPDMKPLAKRAASLVAQFGSVTFTWIPRERNKHADRLANEAMDEAAAGRVWVAKAAESEVPAAPTEDDPAAALPAARDGHPTVFLVVRHGESTFGAQSRFTGREDVPLTSRGRGQARAVAQRIGSAGPVVVLSSPLARCRDTAEAIAQAAGAEVVTDDRLLDERLGDWTGLRLAEIESGWPDRLAVWRDDPGCAPPGGGESFLQVRDRVRPLMTQALHSYRGHTVVVVTHAAVAKMILTTALQVDPSVAYRLRVDTGSLSAFTVAADGSIVVSAVNETGHLAGATDHPN